MSKRHFSKHTRLSEALGGLPGPFIRRLVYQRGMTFAQAARHIAEEYGVLASDGTVRRWMLDWQREQAAQQPESVA